MITGTGAAIDPWEPGHLNPQGDEHRNAIESSPKVGGGPRFAVLVLAPRHYSSAGLAIHW
jgi:hypothetical protein